MQQRKRVLTFVSGNKNKYAEVCAILSDEFEVKNAVVDLPELQGEPRDIAIEKCKIAAKAVGCPVVCEDTSLCFNALKGLPGPYIKWFLEKIGHEGLNNLLHAYEDKSAYALCLFTYCSGPGSVPYVVEGRCNGDIVPARNGGTGFGWDPVFQPHGHTQTYAEMQSELKNKISHRAEALKKLRAFLLELDESSHTSKRKAAADDDEKQ